MEEKQASAGISDSESDGEQLFSPPPPKKVKKKKNTNADTKKNEYDFSDPAEERRLIPPISAYLGKGVTISIKEYRKSNYVSFVRCVKDETKNRFNINIDMLPALRKAVNVFTDHIRKN